MTEAAGLKQASWLEASRRQAWIAFQKAEPPLKTAETWRRVDFNAWRLGQLAEGILPDSRAAAERRSLSLSEEAGALIQAGGERPVYALDPELARRGVILAGLEEAAALHPDLVEPHLKSLQSSPDFRKLEAANLSQFRGGAFLFVPSGVRIEKPIDLLFLQDARDSFSFPRTLVLAGEDSEVTVVEGHQAGEGEARPQAAKPSSVAFSRLAAGKGARVRYFYDQSLPAGTAHFWHQRADLAEGAVLRHYSTLLGSTVHKSELDVRLNGGGSRSELYGILFGGGSQLFDPHTVQWHSGSKSSSNILFRTALKDRARSIYTGLIRIEGDALGCDAFQQNNNLLLSSGARADTTPVLEILTDDVHCKHGATIGPVNPDELFYLCSRGLDPAEAVKMLIMGFFDPILSELPLERLRKHLPERIEGRLSA